MSSLHKADDGKHNISRRVSDRIVWNTQNSQELSSVQSENEVIRANHPTPCSKSHDTWEIANWKYKDVKQNMRFVPLPKKKEENLISKYEIWLTISSFAPAPYLAPSDTISYLPTAKSAITSNLKAEYFSWYLI